MKSLDDISSFLRNELSESAYDYEALDAELDLRAGTIVRILDAAGDYSVMELIVVLDRFGFELEIFDKEVLKKMKAEPAGPASETTVKTKVQMAVDRIREQSVSPKED
jgi:serine/threonine-protein kinase HipA